ncbi:hypothetical protein OHC33_004336 [Knufia fluminis]|uniref:Uncharacterized protein n=1 Tax=Knufia fluminis TaxID=191047 RepID=A0AAN8EFM8_9EURO|nr:hypothetical protein OHC33_004336 [Knufia fluminis]
MSVTTTTTAVVNGILPSAQDAVDEIAEFEKILKLRDEIFAGNHPRLTVPTHALRKVSPASTQLSSHSSAPVQAQQSSQLQLPGLSLTEETERPKSTQPQPATTPSGINPVLLTKSDDLIRAETVLQRQRLEKQLRDQFEQKRLDFRKRPAPNEARPDFDISALLAKALDIVKPISLSKEQSDKEEENDSFDENSFYSSRAPDSTPDRGARSSSDEGVEEEVPANGPATATTQAPNGPRRPSSRTGVHPTAASKPAAPTNASHRNDANAMDVDDEDEEGEYSPPEPEQYATQNGTSSHAASDPRSRQMRRYSDLDQNGKRPASPEQNMRIVRNHITSPIAPQPSRVSPLALTKDSLVSQGRQYQTGRQRGRADSPSQSPEPVSVRNKRRKIERKAEKRGRRGIKQENISPPPFHDIQPLGIAKLPEQDNQPIIIDEPPQPQEIRYAPAPRYIDSPQRPMSRQPEVIPISEPRVMSRATMRPRDDQDLRRVASMHNMRVEQPREYVEYATPTRQRATSYMRVDSPMREVGGYGSENEPPLQEIRVVRTPAPEYREVYQPEPEVRYIPEPMPPPPRERIVVDQYGRRFREIVQERAPATPQRASSYLPPQEAPRYYENYAPSRAASVMVEERPQPRYEEMPPPRAVRQVVEQPGQQAMPSPREAYEPSSGGRSGSVAVFERPAQPSRQVVYADHPGDFRPPVRMASVRPPPSQYEEQPSMQIMPRAASVRPGREGSVFIDDRANVRREYLPEQPRYRVMEPEPQMQAQPRYVDAQGREVLPQPQQDGGVSYLNNPDAGHQSFEVEAGQEVESQNLQLHLMTVSESVEHLVKRSSFDMDDEPSSRSATCGMLDCFSAKESVRETREGYAHRRASRRIGVERHMRVVHNQPHLVEPMKLTVYDDLPATPVALQQPSQMSKLVHQSRKSISRASTRASFTARRWTPSKSSISKPRAVVPADGCQLRRNPSFRPLQLSIYVSDKRLSDLPEFDALSFTEEGEIKLPPRALLRTQSEELLRSRSPLLEEYAPAKPVSMFEQSLSRRMSHVRQNTDSTVLSTSRPPSEYDALNSHPVSWYSMPGIPATMQFVTAPTRSKTTILSPMQEEFTPPPSGAVIINGKVLAFPNIDADRVCTQIAHSSLLPPASGQEHDPAAPSPIIDPGPNRRTTVITKHKMKISESASILLASSNNLAKTRAASLSQVQPHAVEPSEGQKAYFHTDYKTNNRINQWLDSDKDAAHRSRNSSISTVKTTATSSSFAEHRRKRSQFYQLNQVKPAVDAPVAAATEEKRTLTTSTTKAHKTPTPLTLYKPFPPVKAHQTAANIGNHGRSKSSTSLKSHARTHTTSTVASTVATDALFEQPETPELEHEQIFSSAHALPQKSQSSRRTDDANSMTTVDNMKSRTGTMKSTYTAASSYRQRSPSPIPGEIISVTKGQEAGFVFRESTPSPATASPCTPLSAKTQDVEKMMFEMCAAGGYRRVNVGVAF